MSHQPAQLRQCQVEKHFSHSLNDDAFISLVSNNNVKHQVAKEVVQELPKLDDFSVSGMKEDLLDAGHNENKEIINKLMEHIPVNNTNHRESLLNHWQYVSTRLLMNSLKLRGDEAKQEQAIQELKDWKTIQEERIASMQEEPFPVGRRSFSVRASLRQSIRVSLRRSVTSTTKGKSTRAYVGQKLRAGLQQSVAFVKGEATRASTTSRPSLRRGSEASLKCNRPFANRASLDPSFKASLERAVTMSRNMNERIRAEANIEILAINERLAMEESEKVELNKELFMMKAILKSTYRKKAKTEHLIFELSCRKSKSRMNFFGKVTEQDLSNEVQKHFDQVAKVARRKGSMVAPDTDDRSKESWSSKFAEHFARQCKPSRFSMKSVSEKSIIKFCQDNVKVEVLRMQDGSKLYWEDRKVLLKNED